MFRLYDVDIYLYALAGLTGKYKRMTGQTKLSWRHRRQVVIMVGCGWVKLMAETRTTLDVM